MTSDRKNYTKIHQISHHARVLEGVSSLLGWDQETYMPSGSAAIRAEQLKTLAGLIHKERTSKKFSNALAKLIDLKTGEITGKELSESEKAALKYWRRDYIKSIALPAKFVEDFAKLTSQSLLAWRDAKETGEYHRFLPFLDKIVLMSRKKADFLGYEDHPYDALLDLYEPEMTTSEVSRLFGNLQTGVVKLLQKIKSQKQVESSFLCGQVEEKKQLAFGNKILKAMGYDMSKGRLDLSSHPFSSACHPTDSRVTTRMHSDALMSNTFVVLHEGGHGLYEMGLPIEEYGTPLGEAISLGIHESQSRWWETRIGQSKAFWHYYLPIIKDEFKGPLEKVSLDQFYRAINKVEPSFIRVEADEVTYSLHVILRFEIEKALIEGSLSVKEIPELWNAKMKQYLGITPKNNSEGCLQDIHWAMGGFGYFPSYTLGNLYAAHLFKAFEKKEPNWEKKVEGGELLFIKNWLSENVYKYGRRYSSKELLEKVTGQPFAENAYLEYLNTKYATIY